MDRDPAGLGLKRFGHVSDFIRGRSTLFRKHEGVMIFDTSVRYTINNEISEIETKNINMGDGPWVEGFDQACCRYEERVKLLHSGHRAKFHKVKLNAFSIRPLTIPRDEI